MSLMTISYDLEVKKLYQNYSEYLKLVLFSSLKAIIYHPLIVFSTLKGYWEFFNSTRLFDDLALSSLERANELFADDLTLLLRLAHTLQGGEEVFEASTAMSLMPVASTKSCLTCSASPLRSRPWSTNTQVSWSPMALCTRAAATAESTPPDRPQITQQVADLLADLRDLILDDAGGIPVVAEPCALVQEGLDELLAHRGVLDFRILHAVQFAGFVLHGGNGAPLVCASTSKPSGAVLTATPWLIHVF